MATINDEPADIVFQYKNIEKTFTIEKTLGFNDLLQTIRTHFDICAGESIGFVVADTDRCVGVSKTMNLFQFSNQNIPKYVLIVSGNDKTKDGWCKKFMNQYFIPFLSK
ncbi:hypothetical protein I4U23_011863 [Adineta vaga]|nr:hypothetical protein I4U23_011863 [Adineta vaga]